MEARAPYFSTSSHSLDTRPPVLVVCDDPARSRMDEPVEQLGWRAENVALDHVAERMVSQCRAACVLVEVDALGDRDWEDDVSDAIDGSGAPLIVTGSFPSLDRMVAFAARTNADILVDPSPMDIALSLEMVMPVTAGSRVFDAGTEPSAARLRQLSDEVGRIAATLARLSSGPSTAAAELPRSPDMTLGGPEVSGDQLRAVIRARRLRARYFDPELFADPAWDMLLDLLQAEIAQHRVPVSSLCIAAAVPPTTALRWIKTMTDAGLFSRRADPHDGRRVFVELAPTASVALRRYFADVGAVAAA